MEAPLTALPAIARGRPPARLLPRSEERLAVLVGKGSERAFAEVYRRYHQRLYRYCLSMLRNDADAQDALQSAFTGAYAALSSGRRDAPLRPWLYRIAHNESVSLLRRRREHAELTEASAGVGSSTEERAAERERLDRLVSDLGELPERQRGALVMRELGGISHEDIALALQVSPGAAKQAIFDARRSLHEFAEGRAMACDEICRILSDVDGRARRSRRVRAHLRSCAGCRAFAAAIPARRADLRALAPPLGSTAAAGLLLGSLGKGSGGGGAGAGAAGIAGKSAGLTLASKAAVGVALMAGATVGVSTALVHRAHRRSLPSDGISHRAVPPQARAAPVPRSAGAPRAATRHAPRSHRASSPSRSAATAVGPRSAVAGAPPAPGNPEAVHAGSGTAAPRGRSRAHTRVHAPKAKARAPRHSGPPPGQARRHTPATPKAPPREAAASAPRGGERASAHAHGGQGGEGGSASLHGGRGGQPAPTASGAISQPPARAGRTSGSP